MNPSAFQLLHCWERGLQLPPHHRALLLLQTGCPTASTETLGQLSIGRRDAMLLRMREALFGPNVTSHSECPSCSETLELVFSVGDVVVEGSDENVAQHEMIVEGHDVIFRLPNSFDLDAIVSERSEDSRRQRLLKRCIISARCSDVDVSGADLSTSIAESIEAEMSRLDPQANVEIQLSCPACQQQWSAPFDIALFLWAEINSWARRLLQEVHVLARAYGWSEREIVSLHPVKRQLFLQMVCG